MIRVRLIRHAQSAANAGLPTTDPSTIPLTAIGRHQALELADAITSPPDLIVSSSFQRAIDTALPTSRRYPATRFEVWDVEEFTYLAPNRFAGSTQAERKPYVESYWSNGDASKVDGPGAESFDQLLGRANSMLAKLADCGAQDVLVFSHGQFIRAMTWIIEHGDQTGSPKIMREFRTIEERTPLENCWSYQIVFLGGQWIIEDQLDPHAKKKLLTPPPTPQKKILKQKSGMNFLDILN
jgi:broad specificity phosphatase PhoE